MKSGDDEVISLDRERFLGLTVIKGYTVHAGRRKEHENVDRVGALEKHHSYYSYCRSGCFL